MVEKFHRELNALKNDVLEMGILAKEMLQKSVKSLENQDEDLINWVLSKKKDIADMDENIEERALTLLTLYQPMAKDMRTIACILKMITYLARIGRYGKDIANVAKELSTQPHTNKMVNIYHMSKIVSDMIDSDLKAFQNEEDPPVKELEDKDDFLDALRWALFRESITYMMENPQYITIYAHYIMISRYLERCGDYACKMAEKIHYMVVGERIEIK